MSTATATTFTRARQMYDLGYATGTGTIALLVVPSLQEGDRSSESDRVPYLRGLVTALRKNLQAVEEALSAEETAQAHRASEEQERES